MDSHSFTMRDLEEARRRSRHVKQDQSDTRHGTIALIAVAIVLIVREIAMRGWLP